MSNQCSGPPNPVDQTISHYRVIGKIGVTSRTHTRYVALHLNRFFLTLGANWKEVGKVRRVREVVQILLDHTSAA